MLHMIFKLNEFFFMYVNSYERVSVEKSFLGYILLYCICVHESLFTCLCICDYICAYA